MRTWKETISECEDIAREIIKNEAEKEKKLERIKSLSDVWDNIQLFNKPRIWVLDREESGNMKEKCLKKQREKGTLHIKTQLFAAFKKHFEYKDKKWFKSKRIGKDAPW